jgi:hypothetical protein
MRKEKKDTTIKPSYYKHGDKFDVIDVANHFEMNFNLGNVLKYIARAGKKNPVTHIEDLHKAKEYLEREIKYVIDTELEKL